uniref:NADP-dependent oxidoreductase domain-containing protein n=1 Tax=Noctiluca scintillans TaxID=2966 RepID=A0A7S1FKC8_NOCSC
MAVAAPAALLHNNESLPLLGLGCSSGLRKPHVLSALKAGYRHLDTAQYYGWGYHEADVGDAVRESGLDRGGLSIQSKIHPNDLGFEATKRAFTVSLQRLHTDYVDSMLLHKTRCWEGACDRVPEGTWQDSWRALEDIYDEGKTRAIGICDVNDAILDELLAQRVKPHIIQNWMDPFQQDKHIRERCKQEGIQYQAYSTLGPQWVHFRGYKENPVLTNPTLLRIAQTHHREVAQVVLNWAVRHQVAVIPASKNPKRQISNLNSFDFELSHEDMKAIDDLDGTLQPTRAKDPRSVHATWRNRAAALLNIFWVEESGKEVDVGELVPGGSTKMDTWDGHTFRFRRADGSLVAEHPIRSTPSQRVVIDVGREDL